MDETYAGSHANSFAKLRYDVPILMRQTLIDLSVRCGLDFNEGWQTPLTIRFDDTAPNGVENILAYVQMYRDSKGRIGQFLVVNLSAYDKENFNFKKVFAHELVHAMLNDSLGLDSTKLPVWFHEGLAVYGADQGEQMMDVYVSEYPEASESYFINGLEGPHNALDYLEDYLAFKYIHDEHGVNSLRNLIQEVTLKKKDIPSAVDYTCGENFERFKENARKFAEEEVKRVSRSNRTNTYHSERPTRAY